MSGPRHNLERLPSDRTVRPSLAVLLFAWLGAAARLDSVLTKGYVGRSSS